MAGLSRFQQLRDQSGPARLVRRADAATAVAAEVFEEQHVVAEVGILLHLRILTEHRTDAALVLEEQAFQSRRELVGDLIEREQLARTCRALNAKIVAVVVMKLLQR